MSHAFDITRPLPRASRTGSLRPHCRLSESSKNAATGAEQQPPLGIGRGRLSRPSAFMRVLPSEPARASALRSIRDGFLRWRSGFRSCPAAQMSSGTDLSFKFRSRRQGTVHHGGLPRQRPGRQALPDMSCRVHFEPQACRHSSDACCDLDHPATVRARSCERYDPGTGASTRGGGPSRRRAAVSRRRP